MNKLFQKYAGLTFSLLLVQMFSIAQDTNQNLPSTFDDTMRSHDKIYVVMAVCLFILIILFLYLIRIDLKISKKEKKM